VSDGLLDLSRLQAGRAHPDTFDGAVHNCPDFLQIRKPSPGRPVVCMAYIVSRNRLFAAYFTCFCHNIQRFLSFTYVCSTSKYEKSLFHAILFFRIVFVFLEFNGLILRSSPCYSSSFSIFLFGVTATFPHFQRSKEDIAVFSVNRSQ